MTFIKHSSKLQNTVMNQSIKIEDDTSAILNIIGSHCLNVSFFHVYQHIRPSERP